MFLWVVSANGSDLRQDSTCVTCVGGVDSFDTILNLDKTAHNGCAREFDLGLTNLLVSGQESLFKSLSLVCNGTELLSKNLRVK